MRVRIQDAIELAAVAAIGTGVWIQWGFGAALLTVGVVVLAACMVGGVEWRR